MPEGKDISVGPAIEWRDGDVPVSRRFDDPFYSVADGLAEARHVFIDGNELRARWPQMDQCLVAELGFGTGLNFLATVSAWRQFADIDASLHFISFEQFPLDKADMARALSRWPELEDEAARLLGIWDPRYEFLDVAFADRIRLTVFFSDAATRLPQCDFTADAWYLDGFAPAKNPQLWTADLLQAIFECTAPGGSFATYSAAGWVRRNLQTAGFDVVRRPGFGKKREMLAGIRPQSD